MGKCENILKDNNGIPRSESLIIYKTDIKTEDLSATYVIYEVYNPITLERLNLSICNLVDINIDVPVILNNNMETLYNSLTDSGYNIFDGNDSFYQDICATYTTINGTDILLSDRKKDIYTESQNLSICQNGCELQSYNSVTKKAKCKCSFEQESSELNNLNIDDFFTKKVIEQNFFNTLANSNFQVLKCIQLLFSNKILDNIGEILMSAIFFSFLILLISFCVTGKTNLNSSIRNILKNKIIQKEKVRKKRKSKNIKKRKIKKKNFPMTQKGK